MAIATKPKRKSADDFIAGAAKPEEAAGEESGKKVTTLRFPQDLLTRIDKAAKHRGISRTAFILYAVSRALDEGV